MVADEQLHLQASQLYLFSMPAQTNRLGAGANKPSRLRTVWFRPRRVEHAVRLIPNRNKKCRSIPPSHRGKNQQSEKLSEAKRPMGCA